MNLLTGRMNNEGTHFELDGGIVLPLNGGYRQYAGRKMTLGIRPEHIALSSQAEAGGATGASGAPDGRQHAVAASGGKSAASF